MQGKKLLSENADFTKGEIVYNKTPLYIASEKGYINAVKKILEKLKEQKILKENIDNSRVDTLLFKAFTKEIKEIKIEIKDIINNYKFSQTERDLIYEFRSVDEKKSIKIWRKRATESIKK